MPTNDKEKRRAALRRYRERKKIERYGADAVGHNMTGRHGNHATGERHPRWNASERRITSHGYVAVRVSLDHPHAWGPARLKHFKYAYEHHIVMMEALGRPLTLDEVVHHRNGDKTDNRIDNLELTTRAAHAREHGDFPGVRDTLGRFAAGIKRSGHPA